MTRLSFDVVGDPGPQGSKRVVGRAKSGRVIVKENSDKVAPWRQDVVAAAIAAIEREDDFKPFDGPVVLEVNFYHVRPRSHYGTGRNSEVLREQYAPAWKKSSPDLSKLVRSTEDALTTAGVWSDDRLVAMLVARDLWSTRRSGASITVSSLES